MASTMASEASDKDGMREWEVAVLNLRNADCESHVRKSSAIHAARTER